MKYGILYLLLLLFLLVSCGKQRLASEPMRPDSARVAWIFIRKSGLYPHWIVWKDMQI